MINHIFKLIWNKKGANALMILEIFLSFMILFFVFTYAHDSLKKYYTYRGFQTDDKWIVQLSGLSEYDSIEAVRIKQNLKLELQNLPKVESVSMMGWCVPFGQSASTTANDDMGFDLETRLSEFDQDFDKTIGLNMKAGRWFNEDDLQASYEPIVVTQNLVDDYFPGKNMIDSIIQLGVDMRIIGITENFKYNGDFDEDYHMTFSLIGPYSKDAINVLLKMNPGTPASYEEDVSKIVNANLGNTGSIIINMEKARKKLNLDTWIPLTVLLSICAFLAINVALGLFGILWYNINKRKGEIGLRRALGAHSSDISRQFVLEILILTGISIFLGIFFAIQFPILKIGPLPSESMYIAIILTAVTVILIVLLCAFYPSRQAAKIHPATALHED